MLGLAYYNIHLGLAFKNLTFKVTWQSRVLIYVAGATAGLGLLLEVMRLIVPKCFAQRDRSGAIPQGNSHCCCVLFTHIMLLTKYLASH
jgi:hypothetical protein